MVDQQARRKLAEGLRHLVAGRITNDDFEQRYAAGAMGSNDGAVRHVYEAAWTTYSDLETHRLTGRYRLDRAARRDVARCVLFLKSARPYEWPAPSKLADLAWLPVHLATLGVSSRI